MQRAYVDAGDGLTGDMLLGALVDCGASLERIQDAVDTLGVGDVRVTYGRVRRGGAPAASVRVRAPQHTARVDDWRHIQGILRFVAMDEVVRRLSLETIEHLVTAIAEVDEIAVDQLELPEVGVLDTLAVVVGVCTCLHVLGLEGFATDRTPQLPDEDPAATLLLAQLPRVPVSPQTPLTLTGAALLGSHAVPGCRPTRSGRFGAGVGERRHGDHRLRVVLPG